MSGAAALGASAGTRAFRLGVRDVVSLLKPRVVALLVATGAASALAAGGWPGRQVLLAVVVGGGMAAGGAFAVNAALDRDIDALMPRTRGRPVPSGRVSPRTAIALGMALNAVAFALLLAWANLPAAALAMAGTLWYVLVYTAWLKRRTARNIVVGGVAGCFPALVGWSAATGGLDATALALAGVVFLWTPPHFWSLAAILEDEYRGAGVPMLPVVAGPSAAARRAAVYAAAAAVVGLAPVGWGAFGLPYLLTALAAGGWFVGRCLRWAADGGPQLARRVFGGSGWFLVLVFAAAAADRAWRLPGP